MSKVTGLTQELFRVSHLMGADVWDFLLKCTAMTQKCDALTNKDIEFDEYVTFFFGRIAGLLGGNFAYKHS